MDAAVKIFVMNFKLRFDYAVARHVLRLDLFKRYDAAAHLVMNFYQLR